MAVNVFFTDGTVTTYKDADYAERRGDMVVITKWNTKRQANEPVKVFEPGVVSTVEVLKAGVVTGIIDGGGRMTPTSN